jgi:hemerythrin-like domain-containing protein
VDALKLLKTDHDDVKTMLTKLEDTTERAVKTRTEMLGRLRGALSVHEKIEEEFLYPALKQFSETKDIALEAYEEHQVVDDIMADIETTSVENETWAAKLKVMKENLEHHIEEEEGEMFPEARRVMEPEDLADLGERMAARKDELEASLPEKAGRTLGKIAGKVAGS